MKHFLVFLPLWAVCFYTHADSLPVFSTQPTNQTVWPGNTATFSVAATGATSFQWRFNGVDILNATNSTLQVTNVRTNDCGYYMTVAKNATGWVPSGLAYLSAGSYDPISAGSYAPLSNLGGAQANYQIGSAGPINVGTAQVFAGPQLDQMQLVGRTTSVSNGYFDLGSDDPIPTVFNGQTLYYSVHITYPYSGGTFTQSSTVLKLVAGDYPFDLSNLRFPLWPEWPEPVPFSADPYTQYFTAPTIHTCLAGETLHLTNVFYADFDYGTPTGQWRKDGKLIASGTFIPLSSIVFYAAVLNITNIQPSDAGVYDVQVLGDNWIIGPKTFINVQTTYGSGAFAPARINGSNFLADFQGIAGRNYVIQCSSNLLNWNTVSTVSNVTGMTTFTNTLGTNNTQFYRAMLLP
jgi:hypothetical protein